MKPRTTEEIARNARDGAAIDRAFVAAYRRTVLRHRAAGVPLVVWRDGQVVEPFGTRIVSTSSMRMTLSYARTVDQFQTRRRVPKRRQRNPVAVPSNPAT